MAAAGEEEMIAFTINTLARAFGEGIRGHVRKAVVTDWGKSPFTLGGYSCALPGEADQRRQFSRPVNERVFLAGEYQSEHGFATCHGAYISGIDAAQRVAETLGRAGLAPDPLWLAPGALSSSGLTPAERARAMEGMR